MFFVLSKILNIFFSPLVWVVLSIVFGFLFKRNIRKISFRVGVVLLLVFSNGAVFHGVAGLWESKPVAPSDMSYQHRTVVVLGGMVSENQYNGLAKFNQSADRFWQGFYLLKTGVADTLLISGGLGALFDGQRPEAELWEEYLTKTGLQADNILLESVSRNTYENAMNSAAVFERFHLSKKIILVTSAFHMPRARACFEKQGFQVEVFPADPLAGSRPLQWKDYLVPSAGVMESWSVLFREWAGMFMYKLNGYI
ncbi:YdcF family protein [Marinilabilia sp.]|uniref:YdcF family protein n=1 Tax=Marinilabilia sp. TaxID=2021252 RepID=UPI0025C243F1|nr:YdcF family protein [Marinilabilia sp.]